MNMERNKKTQLADIPLKSKKLPEKVEHKLSNEPITKKGRSYSLIFVILKTVHTPQNLLFPSEQVVRI